MFAGLTYADILRPTEKSRALIYDTTLVLTGSLIIALCAQISILLPFTPVPVTGQTFAVLMIASFLGAQRGSLCILTYLAEGAMGLPVFSLGRAGLAMMIGPTGGYLIGFVFAAALVGYLAQKGWDRRFSTTILAMMLGDIVIYFFGILGLSFFIGIKNVLTMGVYPFIIGNVIKILLAAAVLPAGWKIIDKRRNN